MEYIDIESIKDKADELKEKFQSQKPFKYIVFENFFLAEKLRKFIRVIQL